VIFLRADLSQADARIVGVLSKNAQLTELARMKPWEFDTHRHAAELIFQKPQSEISKDERQGSKKIAHGVRYDEQPARISDSLLKDGYIYTEEECDVFRNRYLEALPGILEYQYHTRMLIIRNRYLQDSWGGRIYFKYDRMAPDLYRRGYAWRAAVEVAKILNQKAFIPADRFIKTNALRSKINLQVHDEILISTTPFNDEAWKLACMIKESVEQPRLYDGVELVMPVEFALERRYHSEDQEFKRFPSRDEFNDKLKVVWNERIR